MPGPAARQGDTTAHGGVIVVGNPTVLIEGLPAARLTDMHTCPMQTPAVPPIPHVGGPIVGPGVPTVLIAGLPAATVGDSCVCVGPPDVIVKGASKVMIGTSGGGGGMGGGGGAGQGGQKVKEGKADTKAGADTKVKDDKAKSGKTEDKSQKTDFLNVSVVDKGGKPIAGLNYTVKGPKDTGWSGMLGGKVERTMVESGDHKIELTGIADIRWSTNRIKDDEKVKLQVALIGFEDNTPAKLKIYEVGPNNRRRPFDEIEAKVKDDAIEVEWQYPWSDAPPSEAEPKLSNYYVPRYFFVCEVGGARKESGLLDYRTRIEFSLKDTDGKELADAPYRLHLCSGEVRSGTLDGGGAAKVDNVPPGPWAVEFPDHGAPFEN